MITKKELKTQQRKEIKQRLIQLSNLDEKSQAIFEKLKDVEQFKNSKSVFCYISTNLEVDTSQVISHCFENNKQLSVPYIIEKEMFAITYKSDDKLVENKYSILEPEFNSDKMVKEIDAIIVPLVGFDGVKRLGHGGGYYDKFMQRYPNAFKIGIAFEEQKISNLVVEEHDVLLDMVITEKEIYTKWE